jgi:anti-sigma factor RsiW
MTCPTDNQLAALIDGAMPAAQRTAIESHLGDCDACATLLGEIARGLGFTARAWRDRGERTADEIVAAWRKVIRFVAAAHRRGRIYGALPPDRIVIEDAVTVLDGGVAEPAYLAPERLHGGPPSHAADQFALCAGMWEALVGRPPFRGATPGALAVAMQIAPAPPASDPRDVLAILARGLAADPARRWLDLDALDAALDGRGRPRRRWLAIALAIAALALAALALR